MDPLRFNRSSNLSTDGRSDTDVFPRPGTLAPVEVEAVALEALVRGSVDVGVRSSFARGEAKAVAVDAHDGVAAVLVVRRRRDDAWIVDVVTFAEEGGGWIDLGSGGGTWGDLPLDRDQEAEPSLGPISTGWSVVGDEGLVTVARLRPQRSAGSPRRARKLGMAVDRLVAVSKSLGDDRRWALKHQLAEGSAPCAHEVDPHPNRSRAQRRRQ